MNAQLALHDPAFVHLRGISVEDVCRNLGRTSRQIAGGGARKASGTSGKRAPVILGGTIMHEYGGSGFTDDCQRKRLTFGLLITAAAVQEGRPSPVVWKPILKPLDKALEDRQKTV